MKIALDYDGTVTEDPDGWGLFVIMMRQRGHDIAIVTFRKPEEGTNDLLWFAQTHMLKVHFTARQPKRPTMEQRGWVPDVWIDDQPELIINESDWTDEQYQEWKQSIDENLSGGKPEEPSDPGVDYKTFTLNNA